MIVSIFSIQEFFGGGKGIENRADFGYLWEGGKAGPRLFFPADGMV